MTTEIRANTSARISHLKRETQLRRRAEHFRVRQTLAEMLSRNADADGRARGYLTVRDVGAHAGVSGKAVDRALQHWRRWRVIWIGWRQDGSLEIRFECSVVEDLLAARSKDSPSVVSLLTAHRAKREGEAPWPRVPKTLSQELPQVAETAVANTVV
jgi:hypothetical protein